MRHEILTALPLLLMPFVLGLLVARKKTVGQFQRAGAISQSAALREDEFKALRGWWVRRLESAGAVRRTGTRVWLDEPRWKAYHRVRRIRGMSVAFTLLALLGILVWFGVFE